MKDPESTESKLKANIFTAMSYCNNMYWTSIDLHDFIIMLSLFSLLFKYPVRQHTFSFEAKEK